MINKKVKDVLQFIACLFLLAICVWDAVGQDVSKPLPKGYDARAIQDLIKTNRHYFDDRDWSVTVIDTIPAGHTYDTIYSPLLFDTVVNCICINRQRAALTLVSYESQLDDTSIVIGSSGTATDYPIVCTIIGKLKRPEEL